MGTEAFLGEIQMVAFDFAPPGFALCDGSLLPVAQNQALFSLLGNAFGGDGITSFALPDLRGRAPVGMGIGKGLSPVARGQIGGAEAVRLSTGQLPTHTHTAALADGAVARQRCLSTGGSLTSPVGAVPAAVVESTAGQLPAFASPAQANQDMAPLGIDAKIDIGNAGGNLPVDVRSPFQGVNYIIALQGVYPERG
jgi:microcystin-dependent protein